MPVNGTLMEQMDKPGLLALGNVRRLDPTDSPLRMP